MKIYIAGAHSRGQTMGYYLKYLHHDTEILAYLYDNDEENPSEIDGVPVIYIDDKSILNTSCPVYIGTRGVNQGHLTDTLKKCGMKNIIPVDVKLDLDTRNAFLTKYYASIGRDYNKIDDFHLSEDYREETNSTACVYVANSAFDKPLIDKYSLKDYEKIIQVGAAKTDIRIEADYYDDEGINISEKNRQFCELTGLYWVWKHAKEDYVGLVHYRRHFTIPEDWLLRMEQNNIDVILPLPLCVLPSLDQNYRNRHIEDKWDYMYEYLRNNHPEDFERASVFFRNTSLYSPCNMFIMKREILGKLCQWLFEILFAVERVCGEVEDIYQNRYPGFMSERLITYFFEKNKDKYKVVYADKNFLQ